MRIESRLLFVGLLLIPLLPLAGDLAVAAGGQAPARATAIAVAIEILPGEREKWVDPILAEPVPVAVLGSATLDVQEIDPATLVLAGAAVAKSDDGSLASYEDVNGDRITDLLVSFPSRSIRLDERGTRAWLNGTTRDGRVVMGSGPLASVRSARLERFARVGQELEKLPPIQARMDVLPGDPANVLELSNRGTFEVALLSTPDFDATRVDPLLLRVAGAPVTRRHEGGLASDRDVNGDGRSDLVVEVPKALLQLDATAREIVLTGMTPEGRPLTAADSVSLTQTASFVFESDDPALTPQPASVAFASSSGIAIQDATTASPYPSQIQVSGLPGVISRVRVTLKRLSHTFPSDIDILLVGPTGQSLVLMSDVGSGGAASSVTLTFDDDAAHTLDPVALLTTGTYRPANAGGPDVFPAPAPSPSGALALQAFAGTSPNGTWSLFVVDDRTGDVGSIAGGFTLDFVMAAEFCTAGPITINDASRAAPYPSPIVVAGLAGVASKVTAVLKGFSHTAPANVAALLADPTGQTSLLMANAGGGAPGVSGTTLVLDDNAPLALDPTVNPASGTYRPTAFAPASTFPAPAPPGPYIVGLGVYGGSVPNGTWNVFVEDTTAGNVGTIASVCLDITTMTPIDGQNAAAITIPAGSPISTTGAAGPYPSTIEVSGVIGSVQKATVTLHGVTHTFPRDLDVLLQSPQGLDVLLMSDVGGSNPGIADAELTFDDEAAASIPVLTNVASGTFRPSNDDAEGLDILPLPAPPAPHGSRLVELSGQSPNGSWRLFAFDDRAGDAGRIASGWSLNVRTALPTYSVCNVTFSPIPGGAPVTTQGPSDPYGTGVIINSVPADLDQYKLRVTLNGLTHSSPADLDVLLVGPQGQSTLLMSDAGGGNPGLNGATLFFDDDATAGLPQSATPAPGTYRPTNFGPGDAFPAPAPPGPYGSSLSVFKGTNPLGLWTLYVVDDSAANTGSIGMWCLNFVPSIDAGEVGNLLFSSRTTALWDAAPDATSYALYRGTPAQLQNLDDGVVDACLLGTTSGQQFDGVADVPPPGSFFWYLVRGNNAQGEGPAGFQRLAGLLRARVMESSGTCP